MDREVFLAIIAMLPQLLLVGLVAGFAVRFNGPLARFLATRVGSVSAMGIRIDLLAADVDHAVAARAQAGVPPAVATSVASSDQVAERAVRLREQIAGRTILWVDDHPEGNRLERRLLRRMGVFVESVASNADALESLDDPDSDIDIVISDIGRDTGPSGLELVAALTARPSAPPILLYVAILRPEIPPGAFGITSRPDELMNLVMDAFDRLPEQPRSADH